MYRSGVSGCSRAFNTAINASMGFLLALAILVCGCDGSNMPDPGDQDTGGVIEPKAGYWGMKGGDQTRRNLSADRGPDSPAIAWEQVLEGRVIYNPAVANDGTTYICSGAVLLAIAPDGTEKWRHTCAGTIGGTPYVTNNGDIMLLHSSTHLTRLASNGSVIWEKIDLGLADRRCIGFTATGAGAYIARIDGSDLNLVAFASSSTNRWTVPLDESTTWPEVHTNEHSIVCDHGFSIYVYDLDGSLKFSLAHTEQVRRYFTNLRPDGGITVCMRNRETGDYVLELYTADGDLSTSVPLETYHSSNYNCDDQGNTYLPMGNQGLVVISATGERTDLAAITDPVVYIDPTGRIYTYNETIDTRQIDIFDSSGELLDSIGDFAESDDEAVAFSRNGQYGAMRVAGGSSSCIVGFSVDGINRWTKAGGFAFSGFMLQPSSDSLLVNDYYRVSTYSLDGSMQSTYVFAENKRSLVATPDGALYCVDTDGDLYRYTIGADPVLLDTLGSGSATSNVSTSQARLYLPYQEILYSLNMNGERQYAFVASDYVKTPAISSSETAYVQDVSGLCYAIAADGTEIWHHDTGDFGYTQPMITSDNQVVFAMGNGIRALNTEGKPCWDFTVEGGEVSSLAAARPDGVLLAAIKEAPVDITIDPATNPGGTTTGGQANTSSAVVSSGAESAEATHLASATTTLSDVEFPGLCAIDQAGEILWYLPVEKTVSLLNTDSTGRAYLMTSSGTLQCVDPAGTVIWTHQIIPTGSSTAAGNQMIITGPGQLAVLRGDVLMLFDD
ncbi:hypothetical protein JW859_08045 [bacterium]|nr:hypothetical protein [bacterium]